MRISAVVRGALHVSAAVGMCALTTAAFSQDVGALRDLTRPDDALGVPSIGRILFVLMLMIGLATAVLYGLRKWQPKLEAHFAMGRSIKVLERTLVGGTKIYLMQVDDQRVLVSERRGHVTMLLLPKPAAAESPLS